MKSTVLKIAFFSILLATAIKSENQPKYDTAYVRFLTGVVLLSGSSSLSDEKKAEKYRELVKITGINGDTAVKYLTALYQKPEICKKVYDQIKNELLLQKNEQTNVKKKE